MFLNLNVTVLLYLNYVSQKNIFFFKIWIYKLFLTCIFVLSILMTDLLNLLLTLERTGICLAGKTLRKYFCTNRRVLPAASISFMTDLETVLPVGRVLPAVLRRIKA